MTNDPEREAVLDRWVRNPDGSTGFVHDIPVTEVRPSQQSPKRNTGLGSSVWGMPDLAPGALRPIEPLTRNRILGTGEPVPGSKIAPVLTDVTPLKPR